MSKRRCGSDGFACAGVGGAVTLMAFLGRTRSILALLVALAIGGDAAVAQPPANEAQVKAAFVYNFLKFVDWPAEAFLSARDSLVVGIIGSGPTADATARFLDGKPVNGRTVVIRRLTHEGARPWLHAVFVGNADTAHARRILATMANEPVLSIGESPDFAAKRGVIGLLVEAQKVRFEINTDAAANASLKISSKLLALARIVRSPDTERHAP